MTYRRVYPTCHTLSSNHLFIERLAHTVQTLKFIVSGALLGSDMQHSGYSMGIMGGKLRINSARHAKQFGGTADVINIRMMFGSQHRKARQAFNLCQFDLRVPISTFDQSHHNAAIQTLGQLVEPINNMGSTLAISLHHHTKPVPPSQARLRQNRLNNIQGKI